MFSAENDRALGIPVVNHTYPEGEDGIQISLATICKKIREGMSTAAMKSYAGNVLKQAGFPEGVRAQAAALLAHVRQAVMYAPDALGTEQIQTAMVSLCVEGAPVCIPIGDCDDLVVALGTLCAAVGMDVEVVRQFFGDGVQQHVLVQVLTEEGTWFPLDPSSKSMKPGEKARAVRETTCSPWDGSVTGLSNNAEFVGIGGLPVFIWRPGWRRVPSSMSVEDYMKGFGLGSIWGGLAALQPQLTWLGNVWSVLDAKGRSWDQALADARARAESRTWPAGDPVAKSDLMAILFSSAIHANAMQTFPDVGPEVSDTLGKTWGVLIKQLNIDPTQYTADDIRAQLKKDGASQPVQASFELIALVVGVLGLVAFWIIAFYALAHILDNLLARYFNNQELIRLHSEQDKIAEKHLQDGTPYTDDEKARLKELEDMQRGIYKYNEPSALPGERKPGQPEPDSTWMWVAIAGLGAATILGVVYREEIKKALSEL